MFRRFGSQSLRRSTLEQAVANAAKLAQHRLIVYAYSGLCFFDSHLYGKRLPVTVAVAGLVCGAKHLIVTVLALGLKDGSDQVSRPFEQGARSKPAAPEIDIKSLHAKIVKLTVENVFWKLRSARQAGRLGESVSDRRRED